MSKRCGISATLDGFSVSHFGKSLPSTNLTLTDKASFLIIDASHSLTVI